MRLVISNGAARRFFFPPRSCEAVGLRREKSFFLYWNKDQEFAERLKADLQVTIVSQSWERMTAVYGPIPTLPL